MDDDPENWLMAVDHVAKNSQEIVSQSDAHENVSHCQVCFK